jgi:multisubunit Na+/H+ antiporter MnhC subunit
MTLQQPTVGSRLASHRELVIGLAIIGVAIILMIILTAVFGIQQAGPSYDIAPDPAAGMGLPF